MGFTAIGRLLVRHRRAILALAVLFVVAAGWFGADVASRLTAGGFEDPGAESVRAEHYLSDTMGAGVPLANLHQEPNSAPPLEPLEPVEPLERPPGPAV